MEKTRIGIIGCGVISEVYMNNIRRFYGRIRVVSCADRIREKAEALAASYDIGKVCTVEELLADPQIDIVLNLTIPQAHYEINQKAVTAGKHVYCEKPLALTVREAEELRRLAKEKGVRIGCAPDTFLGAGLQTCRRLIDEGWIGKPVGATANMMNHGTETWHRSPDFYYQPGGGPLFDMGPYYITALVSLLGPVEKAGCFSTKGFEQRRIYSMPRRGESIRVEVPTHYAGILRFRSGAVANINLSFDAWLSNLPKLEIYGTEGTIVVPDPNRFDGEVKLIRREALLDAVEAAPGDEAAGLLSRPEMWEKYRVMPSLYRQPDGNMRGIGLLDMICAIENQRPARAGAELAGHVLEVMECLSREDAVSAVASSCERPAPMPAGLEIGELDE